MERPVERRQTLSWDETPVDEVRHEFSDSPMHEQFGGDEHGKRDEEADVHFDVAKERNASDCSRWRAEGQQQQWQPGGERNHENPAGQQLYMAPFEMRLPKQLKQRSPEDQGEIVWVFEKLEIPRLRVWRLHGHASARIASTRHERPWRATGCRK
jgi:hypothetical protein